MREIELSEFHAQTLFRLNQTMPFTEEYDSLISQIFPEMGENCRIDRNDNTCGYGYDNLGRPPTYARNISKLKVSGYLIRHDSDKNGYWDVLKN